MEAADSEIVKPLWRVLPLVVAVTASLLVQSATPAVAALRGDLDVSFGDGGVSALDLGVDAGARSTPMTFRYVPRQARPMDCLPEVILQGSESANIGPRRSKTVEVPWIFG